MIYQLLLFLQDIAMCSARNVKFQCRPIVADALFSQFFALIIGIETQ